MIWTTDYILSQVFVIVAYLVAAATFFTKDKNKILILNILSILCFISAYIFLQAKAGIIINIINIIRCIWYYLNAKLNRKKDYISLSVCLVLLITFSIIFANSWFDTFAIVAGILITYSLWQDRIVIYRWLMILCSICWIFYAIHIMSLFSIIGESCLLAVAINSVLHYYIVDKYDMSRKMFFTAIRFYLKDKSGHSFDHIIRVLSLCKKLQNSEGGDWEIISTAAIFHDIHRIMSNKAGYYIHPEESLDSVKEILKPFNIEETKLNKILNIIKNHEKKQNFTFKSIEAKIVVDADILDGLGKNGLKRMLKYGKDKHLPLVSDIDINAEDYVPDINPISTKHYIYRTLLPNSRNLKTETGRKLAKIYTEKFEKMIERKFKKYVKN